MASARESIEQFNTISSDHGTRPATAETVVEEQQNSIKQFDYVKKNDDDIELQKPSEPEPEPEPEKPALQDPYLIKLSPGDKKHPFSWSKGYRGFLTVLGGILTLNSTFSSSAPSGNIPQQMQEFTFSQEVGSLLISLFVAGYCVGPILWGPLSERYGRKKIFVITFGPYTIFQMACALAPNTGAILAFRFIGGVFASCPLSNAGALMADLWKPTEIGIAMGIFSVAPFAGPALGPMCSGFMMVSGVKWYWIYWVMTCFAGACFLAVVFLLPETYVPYIEHTMVLKKRKETNDSQYYCALDQRKKPMSETLYYVLVRPFHMFVVEPMLFFITLYMAFVYGCLYLLFEAFPIIYVQKHGLNMGEMGLCFIPLTVGGAISVCLYVYIFNPRYEAAAKKHAPKRVPPEMRLEMALVGGPLLVIGFFIIAWTSYPWITIWAPIVGTLPIGMALIFLFLPLMTYIVDTYLMSAASALAINAVVRSSFGAGFPLFATQMYNKLGVQWATSLVGFIAVLMMPIPFLFYRYGAGLRMKSKFAPKI